MTDHTEELLPCQCGAPAELRNGRVNCSADGCKNACLFTDPEFWNKHMNEQSLHQHIAALEAENERLRATPAQEVRQEAVAEYPWRRREGVLGCKRYMSQTCFEAQSDRMKANYEPNTPQPGPDVRGLVEALESADEYLSDNPFNEISSGSILHRQMKDALATYRQDTQPCPTP